METDTEYEATLRSVTRRADAAEDMLKELANKLRASEDDNAFLRKACVCLFFAALMFLAADVLLLFR